MDFKQCPDFCWENRYVGTICTMIQGFHGKKFVLPEASSVRLRLELIILKLNSIGLWSIKIPSSRTVHKIFAKNIFCYTCLGSNFLLSFFFAKYFCFLCTYLTIGQSREHFMPSSGGKTGKKLGFKIPSKKSRF